MSLRRTLHQGWECREPSSTSSHSFLYIWPAILVTMVIPREASDAQKIDAGITKYIESKYYIQYSLVYWPKKAFFLSDQASKIRALWIRHLSLSQSAHINTVMSKEKYSIGFNYRMFYRNVNSSILTNLCTTLVCLLLECSGAMWGTLFSKRTLINLSQYKD